MVIRNFCLETSNYLENLPRKIDFLTQIHDPQILR